MFIKSLIKNFRKRFSVVIIPHGMNNMKRFNVSLFLVFSILFMALFFCTVSLICFFRVVDWQIISYRHEILKDKVHYLSQELGKNIPFLKDMRYRDEQMREFLKIDSEQKIIESKVDPIMFENLKNITDWIGEDWKEKKSQLQTQFVSLYQEHEALKNSHDEILSYLLSKRHYVRSVPVGYPAKGRVSSKFGNRRSPMHKKSFVFRFHRGVDIANRKGSVVRATAGGYVRYAGNHGKYGKLVTIDHHSFFTTKYAHNYDIIVEVNDYVREGQIIAFMGNTGASTGDHTHYEVLINGVQVDPTNHMRFESAFLFLQNSQDDSVAFLKRHADMKQL